MLRRFLGTHAAAVVLLVVGLGLIGYGDIDSAWAILNIQSDDYLAEIVLDEINVGLLERNEGETEARQIANNTNLWTAETDSLLTKLVPEGQQFTPGKTYMEELRVINNGAIDEYVRVTVYRYWMRDGEKAVDLDPGIIDLHFVTGDWTIDPEASTDERTVLYYCVGAVAPGEATSPFTDTLTVSTEALSNQYAGAEPHIAALVDGVQNHNAGEAITSAWGHNFLGIQGSDDIEDEDVQGTGDVQVIEDNENALASGPSASAGQAVADTRMTPALVGVPVAALAAVASAFYYLFKRKKGEDNNKGAA